VALCYGATTVTTPIARTPYVHIASPSAVKDKRGRFYHPDHMMDYRHEKCLALSRPFGYAIPCCCKICKQMPTFLNVQDPAKWNEFRRIHFLLAKNIEIEEMQKAPTTTLNRHIQQKFSRSKDTVWVAFLDKVPVLTFM